MFNQIVKYITEGLAVSLATYLVAGKKSTTFQIFLIGLTAGLVFMILDLFTPQIGQSARQGAGFGIGLRQSGFLEGFEAEAEADAEADAEAESSIDNEYPNLDQFIEQESLPNPEEPKEVLGAYYAGIKTQCPQRPTPIPYGTLKHAKSTTGSRVTKFAEHASPLNDGAECGFKVTPGMYSKYILQPGYAEGVDPANIYEEQSWSEFRPTATIDAANAGVKSTRSEELVEGFQSESGNSNGNGSNSRLSDVLYSGDLVNITSGTKIMQRSTVNSRILFDKPILDVKTNLSKVRIIHAEEKHDPSKQIPIRYGDPVYIQHNAIISNKNATRFIKYGDRMQSHQDGPLFRTYRIFLKSNANNQDHIRPGDEVIISRADQSGNKTFLKVENDNSVSSEATPNEATAFKINLDRVHELHDRNLCVCPGETLFP